MTQPNELEMMEQYVSGERPPGVWLQLSADCSEEPGAVLDRIRDVMRVVVTQRAKDWPSDDWWMLNLPDWFAEPAKRRSIEACIQDRTLWLLDSWVAAIKDTGWLWWSSKVSDAGLEINLCAYEHPYRIEVFEYLMRAAGATGLDFQEPEPQ